MVNLVGKRIVLDTNIFIYYFQQNKKFGDQARNIFELLFKGQVSGVTSSLALAELLSLQASEEDIALLQSHFLETPNLKIVDVDLDISLESARIRREYGFRLPDSIFLATAVVQKADIFMTNDARLRKFKEVQIIDLKTV